MPSNTLLTITMITREAMRILHNNLVFAKGVNRQYSSEFAQTGAKIGASINVRKPNRYYVSTGANITVQDTTETYTTLTLSTQYNVAISFTSQDLTLSLDDFGKRILSPAMAQLASKIDYDGLAYVAKVYNNVGTPGATPGTVTGANLANASAPLLYLNAGMMLDNNSTPRDENRRVIINPAAMATSVEGLKALFQDSGAISDQYRKGVIGTALGFEFGMDQNVNLVTTGTRANGTVSGANQTGAHVLVTGTGNAATILAGEIFTAAGVYSVNPENQQSTGLLQQFVVTANATADANGAANLSISPSITVAGANIANGTVTASPANGANLTWSGNASTSYPMNVAYHQDAFTLATADLLMPQGVDFAARETYDGISMRIVRQYDISTDLFPCRIDVLAGWAALRPEMACRIWG
jgi:hypothetical protein